MTTLGNYGLLPPDEAFAQAQAAARQALTLDPTSPEAHTALGLVWLDRHWRFDLAIDAYRRAIEVAPGPTPARQMLAEALSFSGRHQQALEVIDEALALEPFDAVLHAVRGIVLNAARCPAEALESLDRALVFGPHFSWVHRYRAYAFSRLGMDGEAAAARIAEARHSALPAAAIAELEAAVARDGLAGFWRWQVARLEASAASGKDLDQHAGAAILLAEAYAGYGVDGTALEWLAQAGEQRGEYVLHLLRSTAFDRLRDDPRYHLVLSDLGLRGAVAPEPACAGPP